MRQAARTLAEAMPNARARTWRARRTTWTRRPSPLCSGSSSGAEPGATGGTPAGDDSVTTASRGSGAPAPARLFARSQPKTSGAQYRR
jgi:hypothetical protein